MTKKWKILETRTLFKNQWFDIKEDKIKISDELAMEGVIVHHFRDWVNVVPLTSKGELILEKQYRHGMGVITIETPSGSMEETDRSPEATAERELFEETGYAYRTLFPLGKSQANPQLMNNYIHHFLALDCTMVAKPKNQWGEEIDFWIEPFDGVLTKIREGEITHSTTVEGVLRADDWLRRNPDKFSFKK